MGMRHVGQLRDSSDSQQALHKFTWPQGTKTLSLARSMQTMHVFPSPSPLSVDGSNNFCLIPLTRSFMSRTVLPITSHWSSINCSSVNAQRSSGVLQVAIVLASSSIITGVMLLAWLAGGLGVIAVGFGIFAMTGTASLL
jgi:hypothetical protein